MSPTGDMHRLPTEVTMRKAAIIRYETRPAAADENQRLVEQVFAELDTERPEGLRYAAFRLDDGVTFVHVVMMEEGDPLPGLAAFREFVGGLGDRIAGPPAREGATVVGSYRLLGDEAR